MQAQPRRPWPRVWLSLALALTLGAALASPAPADPKAGDELGGPERYLTALSTERPFYRPGETAYLRGVVLHAFDRSPLPRTADAWITILGPKGDQVAQGAAQVSDGAWGLSWPVPAETAGGLYRARVTYSEGWAPAEREFEVRVYRAPRLKTQIDFLRDGYGPGDTVEATCSVSRAEGGVPVGAKVTAIARVDGAEVARSDLRVEPDGLARAQLRLPQRIERGEGSLAFVIEDGGVVETASKTLPILLQTVDLSFFPEGGDLVEGLAGRVYFEARTPFGKPADILGRVLDGAEGHEVARFASVHEGRGAFLFTPQPGHRYELQIDEPSGIQRRFPLPEAQATGVSLRALQPTVGIGEALRVSVAASPARDLEVVLRQRERRLDSQLIAGGPQARELVLDAKAAEGALTVTVYAKGGAPLAERLVFRKPAHPLEIEVHAQRQSYAPGDTVELTLRTRRDGKPVGATLGLDVVDEAVLELVETREQAPRLPAMVYLEPEVRELRDAAVYLDPQRRDAAQALDLLLGTQGWRRFAEMSLASFLERYGDQGRRALALRIPLAAVPTTGAGGGGVLRALFGAVDKLALEEDEGGAAFLGGPVRAAAPVPEAAPAPQELPVARPVDRRGPAAGPEAPAAARDAQDAPARPAAGQAPRLADALLRGERRRQAGGLFGKGDLDVVMDGDAGSALVVQRIYAHAARPQRTPDDRVDFTETLFWQTGLRTDAVTGEARVTFALNDSVTSFAIQAEGYDGAGSLGWAKTVVEARRPFYLEPKLPLEVTAGDRIDLPVALVNGLDTDLSLVSLGLELPALLQGEAPPPLFLPADQRVRQVLPLLVRPGAGEVRLALRGSGGPFSDRVERSLRVRPRGFPVEQSWGGLLASGAPAQMTVEVPPAVEPGSLSAELLVYPSPLARMTQALERLIQDPYGCFEQTSSTTYPLTMAQQYFQTHTGVDPALIRRASQKLDAGYKRLVSFECKDHGYEWFGESPGHEALTAYGVLQFTDLAQVRSVDTAMLQRSRAWLLQQRDGKGGFERKRRALHTWVEDPDASDAYIAWALLESGEPGLERELAALEERAPRSTNSYVHALAASALHLGGRRASALALMQRLAQKQKSDGSVAGATGSIVGSRGESLVIETTALATLAWLREPELAGAVERAIRFLAQSCEGGRYGSTQATVLALKAIVAYDAARARPKAAGSLVLRVDGQIVGRPLDFDPSSEGPLQVPGLAAALGAAGSHRVELAMKGGSEMPYSLSLRYHARQPASAPEAPLELATRLSSGTSLEGELTELEVRVRNREATPVPNPVVIVGLPGGLEPRHDQLKELMRAGTLASYEVRGQEVVLYWRSLAGQQELTLSLSLLAAVPGEYEGPASRAYLYYGDEHKRWVPGLGVRVLPKG